MLEPWTLVFIKARERRRRSALLFCVVYEVAAWAVRTEADGVKSAAELCLVLRVAAEAA